MTDLRRTHFNTGMSDRGLSLTAALSHGQLQEVLAMADAAGAKISKAADAVGTQDTFVLATAASQTHTITVVASPVGHGLATGIVTLAVADAGGDTLAVTNVAGVVAIALANATDSKNTLTLVKAALDAASAGQYSTFITGTASTQMVHGGTNDVTARAAGAAAVGALKSSTAGVVALGALSVVPS